MLTVYSTQGSPGASTTAMHLAAHWASQGREILLIEADPAGGSLSHNLGIQFTPGSASFVASGLPVQSNHLIDHAQDVLFENLHVMPAPASPTGARGIFNTFADFSEELRTISENEMAVIIDGGRVTADTAASGLTTSAAGVMVVCRNNNQLPSLEHLRDVLAADPGGDGPQGCSVAVGKSPMSPEEWQENCGLTFCGSIEIVADMATDLSAYLARSKRKSKKWRASLEQVGEKLYPYAQPPVSNRPLRTRPAAPTATPDTDVADDARQAVPATAASFEPAAHHPAGYGQAPPMAPPEDSPAGYGQAPPMAPPEDSPAGYGQAPPMAPPEDSPAGYGQAPPMAPPEDSPAYGQAPPMAPPEDSPAYGQAPPMAPPEDSPAYGQAPPMAPPEDSPAYGQAPPMAPPEDSPAYGQAPPMAPAPQPAHGQSHYLPPTGWPADPQSPSWPGYGEAPPVPPPEGFPVYEQQPAPAYEQQPQHPAQPYEQQPQHPAQPYEQQPPGTYEQQPGTYEQPPQHPAQPYEQQPPGTYEQQPGTYEQPPQYPSQPGTYEQPTAQPEPPAQEATQPQPPEAESPPRPNMKPTGSFRDWAVKLHGSNAQDITAHRGG